ncbi:Copal-8-ol diphosphate hydratase, chloroplastic [Capsicum annuum]|uniref:Copal-8-ol diphosphate hydratase, chloroplastic n=1 Tax=Capsicum annuum TaxID=4072 RepID=A0A2G3AGN5_CAPAN|nr:Copal-8-ol diphosphate hydratase, chloroplastic [Capsicum annuum]
MLNSLKDGISSVSPYDTAWVALIRDTNGSDKPQFPSCLQWIVDNQLCDGSWGEESIFCIYDRLLNTLACVVALTTWNTAPEMRNKGALFIKENICKIETGNVENMTCGFEIVFPALLEKAQHLDIDIPYDAPVLKNICARREMKFKRIPKDLVHTIPTTLLFSLEGFRDLDWKRLLRLQMPDGSFLTSIASTAFAFMETNDQNCLKYLQRVVHKYNGGAPHSYPVDMQARLWAIDRLQRLGISYYFEEEFKDMLDHVQRYWNQEIGIFSGRNSNYCDIDDSCMAIRLLRYDMHWEFHGMLAYPGWKLGHTSSNMVEQMTFGLARRYTGEIGLEMDYSREGESDGKRQVVESEVEMFRHMMRRFIDAPVWSRNETRQMLLNNLLQFLHQLSEETYETLSKDIHLQLHSAWGTWLMSIGEEKSAGQEEAELLVRTINLCGGLMVDDDILSNIDYKNISNITNKVCFKLQSGKVSPRTNEIESNMKELVKLVLENSSCCINKDMKKTFLTVAKSFYYSAHVTEEVLNFHISKVLFEPVE